MPRKSKKQSRKLKRYPRRASRKFKPYSKKKCPRGYISRRSYKLKTKSGRRSKVRSSCVKSPRSRRGRGLKLKRSIPPLRKGTLSKFGYSVKSSQKKRRASLRKAVKALGKATVNRKLSAIRTLTKNTQPSNSRKYASDLKFTKSIK